MAIFRGKSTGLQALMEKVKTREYGTTLELHALLDQIFASPEARPNKLLWMISASHPVVRERGLEHIVATSGTSAVDHLVLAMRELEAKPRAELAKEIVKLAESQVVRAVGPLVHAKDVEQRKVGLDIIAAHPRWSNFLGLLKQALRDPESSIRHRATRILVRGVEDSTVRMMLIELVYADDVGVRRLAIQTLSCSPAVDVIEPFFARFGLEGREEQRWMTECLAALAQNPEARMEERLIPILADERVELRDAAVNLLAAMPNRTRVLRAYFMHIRGLATWLRSRTMASILKLAGSLVEPLAELLEDENMDVRVGAMLMVGESDGHSFIPLVRKLFESDLDWWIRSIAADVLSKHSESPEIVEVLLAELEHPDLRYSIICALGKIASPVVIPHLLGCLKDSNRGVRVAALEALSKKPADDVADAVLMTAGRDPENRVRQKAISVLIGLGPAAAAHLQKLDQVTAKPKSAPDTGLSMVNSELNS